MDEKILVTGGTGRIGKHLINALVKDGEKVRALVKERTVENENVEIFYGDLLDKESLKKAADGVDVIYHLAAVVDYQASKDLMFNVNVVGTKNLLEVSKAKKFIYLSSTATMGKKLKEVPATENTPTRPSEFYGETKLEAEKFVKENGGIIIRSADVYGPGFEEGYFSVFQRLEHGEMPIFGDGKNFLQWIHINDLIQALLLAKENGKPGEVYIVTGKDFKTQKELYEMVCKNLGVNFVEKHTSPSMAKLFLTFKSIGKKEKQKFIPEYINKIAANRTFDIAKARKELGYEPKIDYETGMGEVVEEYKKSKQQEENVTQEQSKEQSQGKD